MERAVERRALEGMMRACRSILMLVRIWCGDFWCDVERRKDIIFLYVEKTESIGEKLDGRIMILDAWKF